MSNYINTPQLNLGHARVLQPTVFFLIKVWRNYLSTSYSQCWFICCCTDGWSYKPNPVLKSLFAEFFFSNLYLNCCHCKIWDHRLNNNYSLNENIWLPACDYVACKKYETLGPGAVKTFIKQKYHQISNVSRTKSQNVNVSCLILRLSAQSRR